MVPNGCESSAAFSACGRYRYSLRRRWGEGGLVAFVGLNPSRADATTNDPTIRRCLAYAKAWGYGALVMLNLFAYRATRPTDLLAAEDPVGPGNDAHLLEAPRLADLTVAAWGVRGSYRGRAAVVRAMLPQLHTLRFTRDGHPAHPLNLPAHLKPQLWQG